MKANLILKTTDTREITNISPDSRKIKENGLYFAIEGLTVDGHDFIDSAIENGAVAIVHTKEVQKQEDVLYVKVDDINVAFNQIASDFWGNPAKRLKIVGTTGTNGKSTTSWIIDDILNIKYNSGYIGTVGIKADDKLVEAPFTTLLPDHYNQIFASMVDNNKEYAVIEVSSQGLHQHRTDFIDFDYAIMTNLTHDHLDYHITMEKYLEAKALLFSQVKADGLAIINNDDLASCEYLKQVATGKVVTYGIENNSDVMAKDITFNPLTTEFTLSYFGSEYQITTNLVGKFNVYNLLAAIIVTLDSGITISEIQEKVKNLSQVAGRMEVIENDLGINLIVDYAHTPDGFEQVFKYFQTITTGDIIVVFGSAGKRDKVKRPVLGEIAGRYSDLVILTEEDCVDEKPHDISLEIASGIVDSKYEIIDDRVEAINYAVKIAKPGDTVAILAKGQEQFLKRINGREFYDGDHIVARNAVKK